MQSQVCVGESTFRRGKAEKNLAPKWKRFMRNWWISLLTKIAQMPAAPHVPPAGRGRTRRRRHGSDAVCICDSQDALVGARCGVSIAGCVAETCAAIHSKFEGNRRSLHASARHRCETPEHGSKLRGRRAGCGPQMHGRQLACAGARSRAHGFCICDRTSLHLRAGATTRRSGQEGNS
jgi:hypothetical protein